MQKVIGATLIAATALATTAALADNAASERSERLAAELAAANADKSPQSNYPPPPCAEGSGMIHGWDES